MMSSFMAQLRMDTTEVHFLGQIVDVSGVRPDPEKVAAIQNFSKPTCVGDIRRFLGMVNQLNKFTPNLADKTKPLNDLLVKKNQWVWISNSIPMRNSENLLQAQVMLNASSI